MLIGFEDLNNWFATNPPLFPHNKVLKSVCIRFFTVCESRNSVYIEFISALLYANIPLHTQN